MWHRAAPVLALILSASLSVPLGAALASAQPPQGGSAADLAGMYTFLHEGEYVQLTIDDGKLSGYVSRFGDADSDKGEVIDQFFDKASIEGDRLSFNTKTVHGTWYDFKGRVLTLPGKLASQEGRRVMKGTLVVHSSDEQGAEKTTQRQVEFKSFPDNLGRQ